MTAFGLVQINTIYGDYIKFIAMKKYILFFIQVVFCIISLNAQRFDNIFSTFTPLYDPPRPVRVMPMPSIIDNSVTINSYMPSASSVRCTDSKTQSGQILMIEDTSDKKPSKSSVVDAEVLFRKFSDNTASITITRLKLDGKWYPMDIKAYRISSFLDTSIGDDRNMWLELMKKFTYIASSEDVLFLF